MMRVNPFFDADPDGPDLDAKADALAAMQTEDDRPFHRFRRIVGRLDRMVEDGRISGIQRREVIQRFMKKHGVTAATNREPRMFSAKALTGDAAGLAAAITLSLMED